MPSKLQDGPTRILGYSRAATSGGGGFTHSKLGTPDEVSVFGILRLTGCRA